VSSIEQTSISITGWSKTIEESSNATIPCAALEALKQQPVSVLLLTSDGILSVSATRREYRSHSQNNDRLFVSGSQDCKHSYKHPHNEASGEGTIKVPW
jgi:hypothetical protein